MARQWARTLVVLATAGLGLAACGDDDLEETGAESLGLLPGNEPPVISAEPLLLVKEGEAYSFTPKASDPDGDTLTFSVSGKPAWMKFDPDTGTVSGNPSGKDVGRYKNLTIEVTDGTYTAETDPILVEVVSATAPVNQPPQISGVPAGEALVDTFYDFIPTVSDPEGDPLSFEILNAPGWVSFDTTIGRMSGTPRIENIGIDTDIVIRVSDGYSSSDLGPFVIAVNDPASLNSAPTIFGTPDPDVLVGQAWSFTPQTSDVDGDTLSFKVFNAPGWASFDPASGTLMGTPDAADVGVYSNISIVVSDGLASASLPGFSIEVIGINTAPTISGRPAQTIEAGQSYTFTPSAQDADGDPLTFSISKRPAWASFSAATGTLSGRPDSGDVGIASGIVISVSDGQESASLPTFSIQVTASNSPPTISGNPPTSILEGSSYSFTPSASDPDGDTLSFSISNQPGWASFNSATGALAGTPGPLDIGSFSGITISVSDGEVSASLAAFAIEVIDVNAAPTISGAPSGSVLVDQPYAFVPQASDPDNGSLSFSVQNLPIWASFNKGNGAITGTPTAGDVGTYSGISITVSDGTLSASLGPFAIEVLAVATGTATLTWQAPTENTDGTPLKDLDGYVVYWGTRSGEYANSETLNSAGTTTYLVDNLLQGKTYYFSVTALNSSGMESSFSNEASKTIR